MQKIIIGALALGLGLGAGAAQAQSSVTVYGVADAGVVLERGSAGGNVTRLTSGEASGSRLGIKGKEDLGGGLVASFVLENGYKIDTGTAGQGGLLFGREASVSLAGSAGKLSLGRQYSPYYRALRDVADPFCDGMAGTALNIFPGIVRVDNMVGYRSAQLGGWSADLAYGMGETAGNSSANRVMAGSAAYEQGPLTMVLAHHQVGDATGDVHARATMLVARYRLDGWTLQAARSVNQDLLGVGSKDTLLGGSWRAGPHRVLASYIDHRDDTLAPRKAHQSALAYLYSLSARTDLYTAWGRIVNRNGAVFKVGNATESGSGPTALDLGMRHIF
jgi:predicted porin